MRKHSIYEETNGLPTYRPMWNIISIMPVMWYVLWIIWFTWWRHQMETFSALMAICARNSPVPGEFPAQRPVTRSFDVYFDLRLNKRLNKQPGGWWFETLSSPSWRHRNELTSENVRERWSNHGDDMAPICHLVTHNRHADRSTGIYFRRGEQETWSGGVIIFCSKYITAPLCHVIFIINYTTNLSSTIDTLSANIRLRKLGSSPRITMTS